MATRQELINAIESMSDAELRQFCEDQAEWFAPIERMIMQANEGTFGCPNCCGTASWARTGRNWSANCIGCGWGAAGMLGAQVGAN